MLLCGAAEGLAGAAGAAEGGRHIACGHTSLASCPYSMVPRSPGQELLAQAQVSVEHAHKVSTRTCLQAARTVQVQPMPGSKLNHSTPASPHT